MHDFVSYRTQAIRYWEWRRIVFNLLLMPPAAIGWIIGGMLGLFNDMNPQRAVHEDLLDFAICAVGANLCFTLVYVFEFLFGSDDPASPWTAHGRWMLYAAGIVIGVILALSSGMLIAAAGFPHG